MFHANTHTHTYRSIANCKRLRRLDVGNNEIDVLVCVQFTHCICMNTTITFSFSLTLSHTQPDALGKLGELSELWVDCNNIADLPLVRSV